MPPGAGLSVGALLGNLENIDVMILTHFGQQMAADHTGKEPGALELGGLTRLLRRRPGEGKGLAGSPSCWQSLN